jgi:hypothetical protein
MDDHDLLMDADGPSDADQKSHSRVMVGGFGGALIAFGALWIALAVASEITARICSIAMWVTAGPIRRYDEQILRARRDRR